MLRRLLSPLILVPLGLGLFIAGAKLALIRHYASDQPFCDQWAGEGANIYRWYHAGALEWRYLFFSHGEHTPALTRVLDLGLFWLNSEQWDSRVEMLACVMIHVLSAMVIWQFVRSVLPGRWPLVAAGMAAVLFALPSNYENFLWGFQTQFLFLLLLGTAHLWGTLHEERLGARWLLAQAAGLCGLFSIAPGFLSAAVAAGMALWRLCVQPRNRWAWATLTVNGLLVLAGVALLTHSFYVPARATASPGPFLVALGHILSWPLRTPFGAFLLHLPAAIFLWKVRRRLSEMSVRLLAGLIIWCWSVAAAIAYGRGSTPSEVAVRYYDPLTMGLLAAGLALCWLVAQTNGRSRQVGAALALGWALTLGCGLWMENRPGHLRGNLEAWRDIHQRQLKALEAYAAGNDPAALERDGLVRSYLPHFQHTLDLLGDGMARESLPPSLAPPLVLQTDRSRSSGPVALAPWSAPSPNGARVVILKGGDFGARFVSQPVIDSGRPVWRFKLMGRLGPGQAGIYLEDGAGRRVTTMDEAADSGGRWKSVNIVRGEGPGRVVIEAAPGVELAVSEPVEVGWLSWLAPKIVSTWACLLGAGVLALGAGIGIGARYEPGGRSRTVPVGVDKIRLA